MYIVTFLLSPFCTIRYVHYTMYSSCSCSFCSQSLLCLSTLLSLVNILESLWILNFGFWIDFYILDSSSYLQRLCLYIVYTVHGKWYVTLSVIQSACIPSTLHTLLKRRAQR